jgi:hypothetical protein
LEKLNNLLDETTILNFRLLWKLVGRYRTHLTVAILLLIAIFSYSYFSQPIIFSVSVPLKTIEKHTVSSDLSSLLPVENTSIVSLNELNVSFGSYAFIKNLANDVIDNPMFSRLNHGAINTGKNLFGYELKKNCKNDKVCMIDVLTNHLGMMYAIEQGQTENRFVLVVSGLDEKSVLELSQVLIKTIEKNRIETRRYLVTKEIESVDNLIKESRGLITELDGFNLLEDNEKVQLEMTDLKEKIRSLQSAINSETSTLSALEARVLENKKNIEKVSKVDRLTRVQDSTLRTRIDEVRQNIASLSSVPEAGRSESDKVILKNLNEELKKLESKISTSFSDNEKRFSDEFGKQQEMYEKTYEFEYSVAKNKILKLTREYEESRLKLDEISKDKISKDATITKLRGDLEFLKNLETKQMSLKLMSSTMTSDLVFEDVAKRAREFRRSSIIKIFLFCFFIVSFVYLISIITRYFLDDKIYSEDDLKNHFKNLDFIGEVPSFD